MQTKFGPVACPPVRSKTKWWAAEKWMAGDKRPRAVVWTPLLECQIAGQNARLNLTRPMTCSLLDSYEFLLLLLFSVNGEKQNVSNK